MLSIKLATSKEERYMIKKFINDNHSYIKYADRPSRKLYWLLYEDDILVGVFGLGSAFSKPKDVNTYMTLHDIDFNEMANNIVFCLFGNKDKNAGSRFLSLLRKDAKSVWKTKYGNTLKAIQTFVLPPRTGSVYKADNWVLIGKTSGNTQITKTIPFSDIDKYNKVIVYHNKRTNEIRYFIKCFTNTEIKLIFTILV